MLRISLEETIPLPLASQISAPARARIDLAFEKAAEKFGQAREQWEGEFAAGQAEARAERKSFAEYARSRLTRRAPSSQDDRGAVLIDCAFIAWFPVNDALCELANSNYRRYDIRSLSWQALEWIARKIDRAYDRDLHLGLNVPLAERWKKPPLIDANGALTPWATKKIEQHPLWAAGKTKWLALAQREAGADMLPLPSPAARNTEQVKAAAETGVPEPVHPASERKPRGRPVTDNIQKLKDLARQLDLPPANDLAKASEGYDKLNAHQRKRLLRSCRYVLSVINRTSKK